MLKNYGVPVPEIRECGSAEDAVALWQDAASPIVLKAVSSRLVHKTEAGGVVLGLDSQEHITAAYRKLDSLGDRVLAEVMVQDGVAEFIIGASRDPVVGLHLIIGMGGVLAEVFRSSRILLLPTTGEEVRTAIGSLQFAPMLNGWRGQPAADLNAVVDVVLKVQEFAIAHRDTLYELDINPVIAGSKSAFAVDGMIWLTRRTTE
jgi:acetyl-CoA synthetase